MKFSDKIKNIPTMIDRLGLLGMHRNKLKSSEEVVPLGSLARYLAWIFLSLIIALSIFLSIMIGQNAKDVLLNKQYEFSSLLAENLNHQIYRRFTLPTLLGFGRIALRQQYQYERLDQIIQQIIHGMNVYDLRIYDYGSTISYATEQEYLGRQDLASEEVGRAIHETGVIYNLDSQTSLLSVFFTPNLAEGSFVLRTTYPLRIGQLQEFDEGSDALMGVLEFKQDLTVDIRQILLFQRSIIAIVLLSTGLIFLIMIIFLNRAEKALAARMAEKERLLQELHQHEKLAGMGRVISGIAHEIRNPLGIMCSSAELLLRRSKDDDTTGKMILQAICDEGKRLSQTVTDFLDYARPRTIDHKPVNISQTLREALIFMNPEFEKRSISIEENFTTQETEFNVLGSKDILYRAFYNIIGNAVQAIPENDAGIIKIMLSSEQDKEQKLWLRVTVSDNGCGFEEEAKAQLLDPFFTTKQHGSGLGLPIVSNIIKVHNGSLTLTSLNDNNNSGAQVDILLPLIK